MELVNIRAKVVDVGEIQMVSKKQHDHGSDHFRWEQLQNSHSMGRNSKSPKGKSLQFQPRVQVETQEKMLIPQKNPNSRKMLMKI